MNLIADENVDKLIVEALRQDGHNVLYVAEFAPSIDDETVMAQAIQNEVLQITEDKTLVNLSTVKGESTRELFSFVLMVYLSKRK